MVVKAFPSTRGLTEEEIRAAIKKGQAILKKLAIKKVVKFGKKLLRVKMSNGETHDRIGGSIAWRNLNPGNIKYGPFARKHGAIGKGGGGHAVFPTKKKGRNAMKALLFTNERGYNKLSILGMAKKYAPVNDPNAHNKPKRYASYVAKKLGVKTSTKLKALNSGQQKKLLNSMIRFEGWVKGKVKKYG